MTWRADLPFSLAWRRETREYRRVTDTDSSAGPTVGATGRRVGNLLIGAAWAMWLLALSWAVLHAVDAALSPCESYWYDDSAHGTPAWQWLPPGYQCTYTAVDSDAVTVVTRPGFEYAALALLLLALPVYGFARRLVPLRADQRVALRRPRRRDLWSD